MLLLPGSQADTILKEYILLTSLISLASCIVMALAPAWKKPRVAGPVVWWLRNDLRLEAGRCRVGLWGRVGLDAESCHLHGILHQTAALFFSQT